MKDDVRHLDALKIDGYRRAYCHRVRRRQVWDPAWGRNRLDEGQPNRLDEGQRYYHLGAAEERDALNRMRRGYLPPAAYALRPV